MSSDEWDRLADYFAGELRATEVARVERWIAADPARAQLVATLHGAWEAVGEIPHLSSRRAAWARLSAAMAADDLAPSPLQTSRIRQRDQWLRGMGEDAWHVRAATASVVVALGVGLCIGIMRHHAGLSTAAEREYATAAGQRLSVTLVDGTRFTLAPASRVRVAADYGRPTGVRGIELEGEAYFAVTHDAAHPFAVHTRTAMAQDVGTAFDVRAYPEDGGARIVVADGVVAVHTAGVCRPRPQRAGARGDACGTRVQVGDVATVTNGSVAVKHGADIATLTAWMQGGLVFRNTPLGEVMREVARTFDLRITIADSEVVNQLVTAAFGPESADEILDEVTAVVGARYERIGQRVVIRHRAGGVGGQQVPGSQGPTPLQTARRGESHE